MSKPATALLAESLPPKVLQIMRSADGGNGLADAPLRWSAKSCTTVDTGDWFFRAPLFAALVGEQFVLVADGPQPLVRVFPEAVLRRAIYNHVTGELAFGATPSSNRLARATFDIPGLRLEPLAAKALLDLVGPAS